MVQELARGESLDTRLRRDRRLNLADSCDIVEQVLSCLQSAHEQEIIHRDVTPSNILIEEREHSARPGVKVIDFGIARSRKRGSEGEVTQICIGTPAYMAPEIVLDETLFDHRVDIYSVGILMFELLYGELPIYHEDLSILFSYKVSKKWESNPIWQQVPPLLKSFFDKALAPLAKDRFYDAVSMLGELYEIRQTLSKETGYVKPLSLPEW
jgi:serine/threonine-protein kinase